ncbi:flavin-dependent dehydrogenase [Clostridium acetobutylicum]|uniref:FAD dependent dehydrogenase n=1 Tax=Clostridium acetobutylicum (strain ATCC 824 / DSM 792 / JCM 1419 / IAM 19013 / LMG 5710 / NBRC 13948 / NRRL B-527 / VKM B-1787 / 2291 / W) TaxID=272562 RepID=Q97TT4_CLOAB|nr:MULTISPECIES: NAD(P)/FAD-dependent oxidoreductase [Clostridium]AAK76759.1 FAD dependent dehydrogenase [Clostridium acetobutylicum ATCC 824]ADZ22795.1 FAD dependent dehydrogenase [Clostridium acetobutylicum EA 2018]AEI34755.1 FAD dependent dehydrogenase [Clostridium acetobutylicum DSM 1731]AWV82303.1 NAD(P)/FAD-dependent oxidoreductase [Clostridium acetobutylicum]MBC2396032.1 NAD(P)/FAD-dependent oxidoreductase [Clostridium acetobutylicum]
MDVAIMGAGISGLSCAITLEKHGIKPIVFEKRNRVGDRFINGEATFSILNRPIKDGLKYIKENYDISLTPTDMIRKLVFHSKNEVGSIDGPMGYVNIRGRHENSYECQLEKQLQTKINFNSTYDYEQLCKEFEYVILATGDGAYSTNLGNYKCDLTSTIKGVTIEGEFLTSIAHSWFNYDVIPKGYGWLIPFSEKEANLVIAYPDYPNNIKLDLNTMWETFYNMACKDLDQNFRITDNFEITKYMIGICNNSIIDNTYFIGNCFGTISPGLGFGQFASILTGVYSAYDICNLDKYDELAKPLFENYNNSLVLRRFLENLNDDNIDLIVKNLDNKFLDGLINKVISNKSHLEILNTLTPTMKLWNNYKKS